jgi:hypothetical protein
MPDPSIGAYVISSSDGSDVEGWLVFPVRPDIYESCQAVLLVVPEPTAEGIEVHLQ